MIFDGDICLIFIYFFNTVFRWKVFCCSVCIIFDLINFCKFATFLKSGKLYFVFWYGNGISVFLFVYFYADKNKLYIYLKILKKHGTQSRVLSLFYFHISKYILVEILVESWLFLRSCSGIIFVLCISFHGCTF